MAFPPKPSVGRAGTCPALSHAGPATLLSKPKDHAYGSDALPSTIDAVGLVPTARNSDVFPFQVE